MTSRQTGAAPLVPLTSCIGSPEKLPTQTPTVKRLEKPTHQLSRMSLLVPVLTAVQNGVESGLSSRNVAERLSRSESMSATSQAVEGSKTRRAAPFVLLASLLHTSGLHSPPCASVRYAP